MHGIFTLCLVNAFSLGFHGRCTLVSLPKSLLTPHTCNQCLEQPKIQILFSYSPPCSDCIPKHLTCHVSLVVLQIRTMCKLEFKIFLPRLFLSHHVNLPALTRESKQRLGPSQDGRKTKDICMKQTKHQINIQTNEEIPNQNLPAKKECKETYLSYPKLWEKHR